MYVQYVVLRWSGAATGLVLPVEPGLLATLYVNANSGSSFPEADPAPRIVRHMQEVYVRPVASRDCIQELESGID